MESESMIKITVLIASRPYPLKVKAADEAAVRKIVKEVNDKINGFQVAYVDRDKQDGLAMAVLTYAFDLFKLRQDPVGTNEPGIQSQLASINELLDQLL